MTIRAVSAMFLLSVAAACAPQQVPTVEAAAAPQTEPMPQCLRPHAIPNHEWHIFFDWRSADLTVRAQTILDEMVQADRRGDHLWILLVGNTDSSETGGRDQDLGMRRAEAARHYLEEQGLKHERIFVEDRGANSPRIPTERGVHEPQNRRVEFVPIGFGSAALHDETHECLGWIRRHCLDKVSIQAHLKCNAALDFLDGIWP